MPLHTLKRVRLMVIISTSLSLGSLIGVCTDEPCVAIYTTSRMSFNENKED